MDIYNANHPTPALNSNELQALQVRQDQYQGFLSFADINSMIFRRDNHPPEAGFRVYLTDLAQQAPATGLNLSRRILATPVLNNGFDDGFMIVSPELSRRLPGPNGTQVQDQRSSDLRKEDATFIVETDSPVTAFFSSAMLAKISQDNPNAEGLSFFLVDLVNVADQHLTHPLQQGKSTSLVSEKGRLQTFLAVATQLDQNDEVVVPSDFTTPSSVMLSNMPSPGYGISVKIEFEVEVDPSPALALLSLQPYIVPWDKD